MSVGLSRLDLRGSRARLAVPRVEDAPELYRMLAGRREILDWIEWSGPADAEEMRARARHWRIDTQGGSNYQLAILRADSGAVAGSLSLRGVDRGGRLDLGYWIGLEHQGRGLASDAVGLAVWLAFEALEAPALTACVFEGNDVSRRVLEKHGFEQAISAGGGGACATSACAGAEQGANARPRWSFVLTRERWNQARERAAEDTPAAALLPQRPLGFEIAFDELRP
jgi:RimJ/RimL family protein N-acetyltransferase